MRIFLQTVYNMCDRIAQMCQTYKKCDCLQVDKCNCIGLSGELKLLKLLYD